VLSEAFHRAVAKVHLLKLHVSLFEPSFAPLAVPFRNNFLLNDVFCLPSEELEWVCEHELVVKGIGVKLFNYFKETLTSKLDHVRPECNPCGH
jgi:hypothetical protein